MSIQSELIERNQRFACTFDRGDLQILPTLRTVMVACGDARVDPAHIFGLDLGEAVILRNNGGRVTRAIIEEIAALAVLVNKATQGQEDGFNVVLLQHTQCGAQRLANPELQTLLKKKLGIDVSDYAITNQEADLIGDIGRLSAAPEIPDTLSVSALLYDVADGSVREIAPSKTVAEWRVDLPGTERHYFEAVEDGETAA